MAAACRHRHIHSMATLKLLAPQEHFLGNAVVLPQGAIARHFASPNSAYFWCHEMKMTYASSLTPKSQTLRVYVA